MLNQENIKDIISSMQEILNKQVILEDRLSDKLLDLSRTLDELIVSYYRNQENRTESV